MPKPIFKNKIVLGIILVVLVGGISGSAYGITKYVERENNVNISFITHAAIMIEFKETVIYIDPYNIGDVSSSWEPADYIFITHNHSDHYDPASLALITQDTTQFIAPESCNDIAAVYDIFGVVPSQNYTLDELSIEAIVMDTLNEGHTREMQYVGYVITINDIAIYHSGDTRLIPEIEALTGRIDVACIPIGGQCSSMGEEEGARAIEILQPRYVIPIHYGDYTNLNLFENYVEVLAPNTKVIWGTSPIMVK